MPNWCLTFIKSLIQDISAKDNEPLSSFKGCSALDLDNLMKVQSVNRLPEIYLQFMLQMGNGFGSRSDDMLWTINELKDFKKNNITFIEKDTFIFMWQNLEVFTLYGFPTAEVNDNPKILMWDESLIEYKMIQTGDTLSEFLISFFAPDHD